VNRTLLQGLLRTELGFEGLVMTDALEMRAISATVGVEEGAVRALAAGADALCLGHDLADDAVDAVVRAIVAAVGERRLSEVRLAEAAQRVARVRLRQDRALADRSVGLAAARRALRVEGEPRLVRPALVVELRPEPSQAAGEVGVGLGELVPGAEVVRLRKGDAVPSVDSSRQLVLVVRDANRYVWERDAADALVTPDAIVVETGLPGWRPARCAAFVQTFGAGLVNLQAAAEALTR
jgi:beta-N-acetylhexosaminidase